MIVDLALITPEQLNGLIEQYIDHAMGNDWDDTPYEVKKEQVQKALQRGKLVVTYSELHESVAIRLRSEYTS